MIKLNDIFWCIRASTEADNYDVYGNAGPRKPWRGKVTEIKGEGRTAAIWLSCFNPDTGEPDLDTNATAVCRPHELFETREAAATEYCKIAIQKAEELEAEAAELRASVAKIMAG